MAQSKTPVAFAILAAVCYGISAPFSKVLLAGIPPAFMAALLYLGAGIGMAAVRAFTRKGAGEVEARLSRNDMPYVVAMVALDIAAPILLMFGLNLSNPATVSLLGNFETVATSLIALLLFREAIGRRLWLSIALITLASVLLSIEEIAGIKLPTGSLLVLLACVCWGIENNCTSRLSLKNPLQIVVVKGFGSGVGALVIALAIGGYNPGIPYVIGALALGFVAYGLSIYFYIRAQRHFGASRTSTFYAFAPFFGVVLSLLVFRDSPSPIFWVALTIMATGAYIAASENHAHRHHHALIEHEHRHRHDDEHHMHEHQPPFQGKHSHAHSHGETEHSHEHTPDSHHVHKH